MRGIDKLLVPPPWTGRAEADAMVSYRPDKIYVERCVADSWVTRNVLRRLADTPVEWLEDSRALLSESRRLSPSLAAAKRSLVLARHKGRFFKDCPASRSRGERNVCCNYFVVNYASNPPELSPSGRLRQLSRPLAGA